MTGQQLVKHCAKSIDISGAVESVVISHSLFRRHVTGRAKHFERARYRAFCLDQSCESEVGQMRFTFLVNQNISWLDVTMKDVVLVRVVNSPRYLGDEFDRAPDRHWLLLCNLIKLATFD